MKRAWERCEIHQVFWFESLKGRDHLEDLCVYEKKILKWILGNRVRE
jgi:hypothetical protein